MVKKPIVIEKSLKDLFDNDFKHVQNLTQDKSLKIEGEIITITTRVHLDFDSGTKYVSFFVPFSKWPMHVCATILDHPEWAHGLTDVANIELKRPYGPLFSPRTLKFVGRVILYLNHKLPQQAREQLLDLAKDRDISLGIVDITSATERIFYEKPLVFISHDSQDKKTIAEPLAYKLYTRSCKAWYDEFSLSIGHNLTTSILHGIETCEVCVLVVTPNLLGNVSWAKWESEVVLKKMSEGKKLLLPVWFGVNGEEVARFNPQLARVVALDWAEGVDVIAKEIGNKVHDMYSSRDKP